MTLNDLVGHSPTAGLIKCNSTNICATFRSVSTDTERRAVPRLLVDVYLQFANAWSCKIRNVS